MLWISIAILGYLFLAITNVNDKFLIEKHIKQPFVYVFFIGVLGLASLVLIPFGFVPIDPFSIFIDLIVGVFFIFALVMFFRALDSSEASRVVPFIGGLTPFFIFILSFIFLQERLALKDIIALCILILGSVLITLSPQKKKGISTSDLLWALGAAAVFAVVYTLSKYIYNNQPFITGFVWMRVGSFLAILGFLLDEKDRSVIFNTVKKVKNQIKFYYLGNQIFGGIGFILINYAIFSASVTLVNALQGVQYIFVLVLVSLVTLFYPKLIKEKISKKIVVKKVMAVAVILAGLFLLYI